MSKEKKQRENRGWFKPGPDPRRHQFSDAECVAGGIQGFKNCLEKRPEMYGYLMARALSAGRQRERRLRAGERQHTAARQ